MCNIQTPGSPLCVSPPGFSSSPVMLAEQAKSAGVEDTQMIKDDDEFFMFTFKVSPCAKKSLHEWNTCCYAHAGEKAARRDPKHFAYNSVACPEMLQSGKCPRGDSCDMAHSVFEYWLHPQRYRTTLCRDGAACNRSVCFFAHSELQLRALTAPADASSSNPMSLKGKFSVSGLPAAAQHRRSQDSRTAARPSPQARGPVRHNSGCMLQQQQQQRVAVLGPAYTGSSSSSGSLDSASLPVGCAGLASSYSMGSSSPVMPLPVMLPGNNNNLAAAAAGVQHGVGQLNDLIAAFQAQAISSQQRLAIANAAAEEANLQLQAMWTTLGMTGDAGCMPVSSEYAGASCSSPVALMNVAGQLQGSCGAVGLASPLSLPPSTYAYSPTASLAVQPQQQQQMLMNCGSLGHTSSLAGVGSADRLLLQQLSPAASGSIQQPVLMAALSADVAFMSMAGVPAAASGAPQVSPHGVPAGYMQLAGQAAGLAW